MPGEFEKHSGTYMIWPERPDNWRLGAKPAQHVFTEVANAIVVSDNVLLDASSNKYGKVTGVEVKPCEETYFDLKNEKFVKRTINNRNDIYITAEAEVVEHDFGYELGDHKIRIGEKQIVSAPAYGVEGYIVEIFD